MDNSLWYISNSTPIQCTLEHPIPRYGQAHFEVKASKQVNLDFILHSKQAMPKTRSAILKSVPPTWRPGKASENIDIVKFHQQFDGYVTRQNAWRMLNELESGQYPTFYFKDWYNKDQITSVGLSSVNFIKSYDEFNNCIDQLLPYDFDDIAYSILNSVKEYLAQLGLDDNKIQVKGFGEKHHVADNRDVLGRMQNRRVVISIEREDI